ncbi:DNA-binding MurR/RpiR family transcriptional regulator [Actinoplanes octamycinicus]|uniref:DNA-binding MurR/RpiR family transcriptional regulator n=1 Tax=Actinoplanes octamycinicus TaxID=135948 RepID=A0A7W7M9Q9_9ACTN|nr:MurR/RpiR family transcriptional regulator [Actinoplanes octamycinicus]MBB4742080.1 DNA-binding MurR/RpiR family transcriptional regulator [Actinoplanes octamycinicus]
MTESVGVAGLVRERLGECSPSERRVGRALLAEYPSAGLETVASLAERAEVSAPTVLRFLSRLGFRGFPEFQRVLRAELAERQASPLAAYAAPEDGTAGPRSRAADVLPQAVAGTLGDLPEAELERAVRLLADRQLRITAAGGRFSTLLAQYLVFHLIQLRGNSRMLPAAPVERVDALVDVGRKDLFVLFDFRRYEQPTQQLARSVSERGARIILCTDRWLSPIAGLADVVLPSRVDSPSMYDSFVPALALLEVLVAGVVDKLGPAAQERLAAVEAVSQPYL